MKVSSSEILDIIKEIGVLVDVQGIKDDKSLIDQGVDSLDMANLFLHIEEKFGIKISQETSMSLKSINDIIAFLEQN